MRLQHSEWRAIFVKDFFKSTNESPSIYNKSCDLQPGLYLQIPTENQPNVVAIISSSDGCATLTFSQSMLLSFNEKLIIESNYVSYVLNYEPPTIWPYTEG